MKAVLQETALEAGLKISRCYLGTILKTINICDGDQRTRNLLQLADNFFQKSRIKSYRDAIKRSYIDTCSFGHRQPLIEA